MNTHARLADRETYVFSCECTRLATPSKLWSWRTETTLADETSQQDFYSAKEVILNEVHMFDIWRQC